MEIDLFVDPTRPRQTSATLFDQIRDAITTARLAPGDRLPTSRDLAAELGVARSTIATVYAHLIGEGFVEARTGDGTYVAHHPASTPPRRRAAPTALTPRRAVAPPPQPAVISDVRIDLRTGRPDPQLFPLVDWRRCVTTALQSPPPGYGDPAGLPALRRALAAWIRRSRGVVAEPEQVLVTAGAQQSFDLLSRVLLAPGDTIAIEEPGYAPARRVFEHNGLRVAPVPVDSDGIVVEAIPSSARAVYVTPSHQLPTGVTMTAARRRALLALAHQRSLAIIEDDYDTEYRHVDRPLEPLQLLDTAGRVHRDLWHVAVVDRHGGADGVLEQPDQSNATCDPAVLLGLPVPDFAILGEEIRQLFPPLGVDEPEVPRLDALDLLDCDERFQVHQQSTERPNGCIT